MNTFVELELLEGRRLAPLVLQLLQSGQHLANSNLSRGAQEVQGHRFLSSPSRQEGPCLSLSQPC